MKYVTIHQGKNRTLIMPFESSDRNEYQTARNIAVNHGGSVAMISEPGDPRPRYNTRKKRKV